MSNKINRRAFLGMALTFGAITALNPSTASAAPTAEEVAAVKEQLDAMTAELDSAVDQYNGAMEAYEAATAKCEEAQAQIDSAQERIAGLQGDLATRATSMYRSGSMSYLDVLLGVASFDDFATVWDTLNNLNEDDADLVAENKVAKSELESAKAELDAQQTEAETQLAIAEQYQAEIEAQTAAYEAQYNSLSAEYQEALAAQAAAEAAAAEAAAAQAAAASSSNSGGGSSSSGSSSSSSSSFSSSAASSIPTNGSVVDYAASRIGCPYVWAAAGPDAFDCSGLTMWCYAQVGIYISHYTESQYAEARARLSPDAAAAGDILYRSGHVAISTGGTNYIHAPHSGAYVCYGSGGYWACALRF